MAIEKIDISKTESREVVVTLHFDNQAWADLQYHELVHRLNQYGVLDLNIVLPEGLRPKQGAE